MVNLRSVSFFGLLLSASAFQGPSHVLQLTGGSTTSRFDSSAMTSSTELCMSKDSNDEKYQNKVAEILANFMTKDGQNANKEDPLGNINFDSPKLQKKMSLEALAKALDKELYESEWFVTGKVNPVYFADSFKFQDPDVAIEGIEGKFSSKKASDHPYCSFVFVIRFFASYFAAQIDC